MFSGIIEGTGEVQSVVPGDGASRLTIDLGSLRDAWTDLALGASVAIDGVCLTVSAIDGRLVTFDVVAETLRCSTLEQRMPGDRVNLERSLRAGAPIDGHFVQGHVDGIGTVLGLEVDGADYRLSVAPPAEMMPHMVPKGSVAVDGVSLTIATVGSDHFSVALIPTTLSWTTLGRRGVGDTVNVETDVLVRTVVRLLQSAKDEGDVTLDTLRRAGFL